MNAFSQKYYLSDLLPYEIDKKTGADLRNGLKEYQMIITAFSEAVNALSLGDLRKFDPLVGENACEIRAVWMAIIASKKLINVSGILKENLNVLDRIRSLLQQKSIEKLMSSGISLLKLSKIENLFISLSLEEIFIFQSFILTESKVIISDECSGYSFCIKEKCDPKRIKRFGDISSSFADNLISKLRKFIAAASVQFVRENAKKLQDQSLMTMLSDEFTIFHNNHLLCTPMFWTYKSVLSTLRQERIPLIICAKFLKKDVEGYKILDTDCLFFEFIANSHQELVLKHVTEADYNKAACVIQGIVFFQQERPMSKLQWRQEILKHPISSVILAGAADHRQYPDLEQNEKIYLLNNIEYETYKSFAKSEGFSLDNPRIFFIQHVYPSLVGSIFSTDEKMFAEIQAVSI